MKIKANLQILCSKPDFAGNQEYGFCYTDTATGKNVLGTVSGGRSGISAAVRLHMGLEDGEYIVQETEMKIREFNRWKEGVPYAGCPSRKIAEFIKQQLNCPAANEVGS